MKKTIIASLFFLVLLGSNINAQGSSSGEKYGRTLNLGVGVGYYGYVGNTMPVLHADFEFDVARNFTLAPFISFYSYRKGYYYGSSDNRVRYYYHEVVITPGIKGTYYFDQLLNAGANWDFYAAGSLGFAISNSYWDSGYLGDKTVFHGRDPLFMDLHVGAEYHFNARLGAFLDLSTGVSTIGLAIH